MSNIRTQVVSGDRRVITKVIEGQRRVSCECCVAEVVCCPYAADQLGIGYFEEDLPDTITINDYVDVPRTASRTGTTFQTENFQNPSFPSVTTSVRLERAIDSFDALVWQIVVINNGFPGDPVSSSPCLFYVLPETPNFYDNTVWQDDFLDTYSYTVVFNGNTIESGTITRIGLCVWSNTNIVNQIGGALFTGVAYSDATNGFGDFGVPLAWATYDGNDVKATKTPPHNSPEGTYPVFGGLYDGAVATVFQ
jgi:hypothetical protein